MGRKESRELGCYIELEDCNFATTCREVLFIFDHVRLMLTSYIIFEYERRLMMKTQEVREKYTIEYCPFCDSEQVIFAKGVTACPSCGMPLAPCSICEECTSNCPYGCDGVHDGNLKITNPRISKEEVSKIYALL